MFCVAKTLNIEKAKQQHRLRRDAQLLLGRCADLEFEKVRFGKSGDGRDGRFPEELKCLMMKM